jgi:DNA mismatch repair protein MutS2
LLSAIADRCAGALGRQRAASLSFALTREEAATWQDEAVEATRTLRQGAPLPVTDVPDVRDALERARRGAVLSPEDLRAIGMMLGAARALRSFLGASRAKLPALYRACSTDPGLDVAAESIARCFEPDGSLSDGASPQLKELRAQWLATRRRMLAKMDDLMDRHAEILRDRFVTEREGRWVLPVRSDAHERFAGIVHAASSSGHTLFVEPRAVVPIGNRLKVIEAEVKREEEAICARLTLELTDVQASLVSACEALALADLRSAIARLALDLELTFPSIIEEPRLDLKCARHPLLSLAQRENAESGRPESSKVVASDVAIEPGHALVVSGPNAGGKTVALKTLGMAALMARCGLPLACDETSRIGLFDVVLTDVGDDQSLKSSLSTFSAHVSNLATVLEQARRGALVLLDELAGGTDPREGEALAAAMLDALCARGATIVTTTHYEGLKSLALADDRFENASVGFDLATMTPTFELTVGIPGRSSALAVAGRFGIPDSVLQRARQFLSGQDQDFEGMVKTLHDERAALVLARAAAEDREQEALAARVRLEDELQAIKANERHALSTEARSLMDRVRTARAELNEARAKLRSKKIEAQPLRDAEQALDRIATELAVGGPIESFLAEKPKSDGSALVLRKGVRVWVSRLRCEADVVDVSSDGSVRVAPGRSS